MWEEALFPPQTIFYFLVAHYSGHIFLTVGELEGTQQAPPTFV